MRGGRREGIEKGEKGRVGDKDRRYEKGEEQGNKKMGKEEEDGGKQNLRKRTRVKRGRRKTLVFTREKYLPSFLWVCQLSPTVLQ